MKWLNTKTFEFEEPSLVETILGELNQRSTLVAADTPFALAVAFAEMTEKSKTWDGFLRRNPPALKPPPFAAPIADLMGFLGPVIATLAMPEVAKEDWSPTRG